MFPHSLTDAVLTRRVMDAVAASTASTSSTGVDMLGYTGVRFIASLGTLTAGSSPTMQAQSSSDDGVADAYAAIGSATAAMPDADDNKLLIVQVYRPKERYVRVNIPLATQNRVIDGIVAELYRAEQQAVAKHSTVSAQQMDVNV